MAIFQGSVLYRAKQLNGHKQQAARACFVWWGSNGELAPPVPLAGRVFTAEAVHPQVETARDGVEDPRAPSRFTGKDQPPTLKTDSADLQMEAVPP